MLTKSTSKFSVKKLKKSNSSNSDFNPKKGWSKFLGMLQELGKALQFPIAVLPFAAVLNRFGALGIQYSDIDGTIGERIGYWISFMIQQPGAVVFDNLALLFAIGIAFGLSKDHRGEVALIGAVFYFALIALTSIENSLPYMIYGKTMGFETFNVNMDGFKIEKEILIGISDDALSKGKGLSGLFYVKNYTSFVIDDKGVLAQWNNLTGQSIVWTGDTINVKVVSGGTYVLSIGVLGGITSGCFAAYFYNKFSEVKLPAALSFFSGRRFVPMVALVAVIPVALFFAIIWPWIQYVLMLFGSSVADPSNPVIAVPGTAIYAMLNRLLLPFGLHQILNTFFWFQLPIQGYVISPITGEIISATELIVNGDINAFTAGVEGSGLFQAGFFPIMMGGIPAIAIAMIMTAKKENRQQVAGFLGGVAMVALVSGITEPIEFSFAFISPVLLVIHALLSAMFMAFSTSMQIQIGFGFSAGLIDYIVSFAQAWGFACHNDSVGPVVSNPLWTLVLTITAFGIYFTIFYFIILKMNILTPGREEMYLASASMQNKELVTSAGVDKNNKYAVQADKILQAIRRDNIVKIDNCATRLRLVLKDNQNIDEAAIKAAGAFGIKRLGTESLQIVIGADVVFTADEMNKLCEVK